MRKTVFVLFTIFSIVSSCKSTKNPQTDPMTEKEQKDLLREEVDKANKQNASKNASSDTNNIVNSNSNSEQNMSDKERVPDSLLARIERTACFGRCPTYTLSVYKTGYATYHGEQWVEKEGDYEAFVGSHIIETLQDMAEKINFMELANEYNSPGVTDLPSTITTMRIDDEVKVVENRMGGPEKLTAFEKLFDSLFQDIKWEKVSE